MRIANISDIRKLNATSDFMTNFWIEFDRNNFSIK